MTDINKVIRIEDDRLEKLGVYFQHRDIGTRYGITFERFVYLEIHGLWSQYVISDL